MTSQNVKGLKEHLRRTGQTWVLMSRCGLKAGRGRDHSQPCFHCGGDDRLWYSERDETLNCRKQEDGCPVRSMDVLALYQYKNGVDFKTAFDRIAESAGYITDTKRKTGGKPKRYHERKTEYVYHDEDGQEVYRIIRTDFIDESGKPDKVCCPVYRDSSGKLVYREFGILYPYHLPDVLQAEMVFIVEGEKTADCLNQVLQATRRNTIVATTSQGGSPRGYLWREFLLRHPDIANKAIRLLPDNDAPGVKYAQTVATAILHANPSADVKIIELPGLPEGGDFVDWYAEFELDGKDESAAIETLFALCERAAKTEPPKADSETTTEPTGKAKSKLSPTGVPLLDRFCKNLKPYKFYSTGERMTQMEYTVQAIDELIRVAKVKKLDLAQKNGDFYCYNGRYWERILPTSFHTFLRNATRRFGIPKDLSRYHKFQEKIRAQFKDIADFPFVQNDGTIRINLKSGTLEFKDGQEPKLVSFDKRHGLCYQLDYDYNPAADYPQYQKFLDRCVPDAALQSILEEYAGYIFIKRLNFEKILFLYGSGANGKSVFLAALTALLGKPNVTEHSLESITKKQEYRALLANGLVNVCAESALTLNIDVFKKLASREPLECRKLYENPITISDYSLQIFATNVLPRTTEATEGYFRRFLLIPFDQFIPLSERNHRMNTVEFWQESGELPGILNRIIAGLQRLLRNGGFTPSEKSDSLLEEYRRDSDSVALFVSNKGYSPDAAVKIPLKELYGEYVEYCRDSGLKAVSDRTLATRLRSLGYHVDKGSGNLTFVFAVKTISIEQF